MLNKDNYIVDPIDTKAALDIVIKNHYLHRAAPCSRAFGIFEKGGFFGGILKGVVCYGVPAYNPILKSICGKDEMNNVYELTRLWIEDVVPKNGESFLISNSIKKLDKEIIISYADTTQNHLGIVYQASNWQYIGLTKPVKDIRIRGMDLHPASITDKFRGQKNRTEKIKKMFGEENIYREDRAQKFRYVTFNADKRRKKELMKKLTYSILPYPKKEHALYS
jgi:hypothetical protein